MIACNFFNKKNGEWLGSISIERKIDSKFFHSIKNEMQWLAEIDNVENIIGFIMSKVEFDYNKITDNYYKYDKIELFSINGKLQAMYLNNVCIRTF